MQLRQEPQSHWWIFRRVPRFVYTLVLTLIFLISFSGLSIASAQALPGDQFYPFKRGAENIRLSLSVSPESHRAVEDLYQTRRIREVERLLASARTSFVAFYGKLNSQEASRWNIGGIDVRLTSDTIVIGDIPLGAVVEVEGMTLAEGWVQASEIHLQTFGFVGYVENISPDLWQIGGRTVQITQDSRIGSGIRVGDWVIASVRSDDFGNLFAQLIDTSNLATPTVTPTHTPSPTMHPPTPTLAATQTSTSILKDTDDGADAGQGEDLGDEASDEFDTAENEDADMDDANSKDHDDDEKAEKEDEGEDEEEKEDEKDEEDEEDEKDEDGEDEEDGDPKDGRGRAGN